MVLWMAGWLVDPKRSNTDVLACCVLTFGIFLVTWDVVASLVDFWNVKDPDILSACLMLHTRCCSTLGSGPTTCDPSNGAVRTTLRACGWNPKFFSRASLLSICRLDASANPEDMAATCASGITANFSLSNLVLSSLGDSSEITDGTRESARDGYMADLLASSSVSMAILWDIWKLACGFQSPNPSVFGGLVKYNTSLCILTLYGSRGNTYFTVKCLNVELSVFSISESVVLSTSSSSLSPCAILAVDAIVSSKEGWSIQETLSVFSSSGRSNRDALTALLVFTGTILKAPSETLDIFSVFSARIAAWKSNGESGRLSGDLDECDDLQCDELSEPSKLYRSILVVGRDFLTGDRDLSGILSHIWRADSGDGDFLTTALEVETVAGPEGWSCDCPLCCAIFIIVMKSISCIWLMYLGMDGKIVAPESTDTSGLSAGGWCVTGICSDGGWSYPGIKRGMETLCGPSPDWSCDGPATPAGLAHAAGCSRAGSAMHDGAALSAVPGRQGCSPRVISGSPASRPSVPSRQSLAGWPCLPGRQAVPGRQPLLGHPPVTSRLLE